MDSIVHPVIANVHLVMELPLTVLRVNRVTDGSTSLATLPVQLEHT